MTGSELSEDEVFELLKSTRRRYALHYLLHEGSPGDLSTLATHVAAWEYETTPEELMPKQRKRVYIALYQTHLPKLEDAGIIDFDGDTGTIHLLDGARTLDKYLSADARPTTPWYHYYLSLSVVSLLFIGGVWVDVAPLTFLSCPAAMTLILSSYTLLALGQYLRSHWWTRQGPPPEH